MACFAEKVRQIAKKCWISPIFLQDKIVLCSPNQRIIQNLLLSVVFGGTYDAGRFSCRTAPWGSPKRFRRPKSFLHGSSVAATILISLFTKGVGGLVSWKFRLTHWENTMGTMHNWHLWDKSVDEYIRKAESRCEQAKFNLDEARREFRWRASDAKMKGWLQDLRVAFMKAARAKYRRALLEYVLAKVERDRMTKLAYEELANRTHRPDPSGGTTRAPIGAIEPTEKVMVLTEQDSQAIVKKTQDRLKSVAKDMLTDQASKMALFGTASPADRERERKVGEKLMKIHQDALREVQDNPTTANILELIVTIEPIQYGLTSAYDPESEAKAQVAFEAAAAAANKLLSRAQTALDKDSTVTNRWTAAKMRELAQLLGGGDN
jgi:hypothetical protein